MNKRELIQKTKNLRVLYVEDEVSVRTFTAMLFKNYFAEIVEADDGEDGLKKYHQGDFDLIISDRNLPKLNGEELIERVLQDNPNQKMVLMTAENDRDYEILKEDTVFFLQKPLIAEEFDKLLTRITQ